MDVLSEPYVPCRITSGLIGVRKLRDCAIYQSDLRYMARLIDYGLLEFLLLCLSEIRGIKCSKYDVHESPDESVVSGQPLFE